MARPDPFLDSLLQQLHELPNLRSRAMFGAFGLYCGSTFFGIVFRSKLYLRTTPVTRLRFTAWGMGPFRPNAKQTLRNYYEVPAEVIASGEVLTWARESVEQAGDHHSV